MRPRLDGRTVGALVRARIGHVEIDTLDRRAEGGDELAAAGRFHLRQDFRLHLQVPGIVELAGLEHRARRRGRVAAALQRHRREGRLGRIAVVRVGLELDHVIGAKR